ncbi:TerB family tellurite resistance protein [Chitinophaga defluvii]|uniref:TerB family tellurite resistance protein n=1 Tax=Chitinophaga defluvii TaxID=3163343 RepID=A0ABV2TBB6_9BACT
MKKVIVILIMWMGLSTPIRGYTQAAELAQLALNIEKLNQFRQILQKMYDAYKIISAGYDKVKDITSGNFKLHQVFLDALFQVSPGVRDYPRIKDIVNNQIAIIKEYKDAFRTFQLSNVFDQGQLDYLDEVYKRIFDDSLRNLEELVMIITAGQLRMNDAERLTAIDRIHNSLKSKLAFLREFNDEHALIAIQSLREKAEQETIKKIYELK